ncbi:MAG: S41 family peptidase [Gemmatimonadaceae bacterium]
MRRVRPKIIALSLLFPLLIGGFVVQERATRDGARLFDQVLSLVGDRFVDTVDAAALYEKAARGLVQQLGDPYSELLSPKQLQRFSTSSTGRYSGIGMQIENQEGSITVVRVFPNTPAEKAGVVEGDRIVGVDTASTRGWTTQQVSDALLGVPGTKVTVRFARPGVAQVIEHRVQRAEIHIPAVPYALMLDDQIAYIPLQTFNETATQELQEAIRRLTNAGAHGIILDLRNNPGGILDQGLAVADLFLKEGQQIAQVRARQGQSQSFLARGRVHIASRPLVVMVDNSSASAAEIVAGALQDHDRALVVGTTSYGKGLVQTVFPLDGGYALKMTTAKWFTPSGRTIQKDRTAETPSATAADEPPDSLERESVKKDRPVFKSDAGRNVYGGGGITPDVIVPEDTLSTAEQEFARALAPKSAVVRSVLYNYALDLKSKVSRGFTPQPAWREEFFQRLDSSKVAINRKQYDSAATLVDRWISTQVTRFAFGDSAEFRRSIPRDPQLLRAIELLKKGRTQQDLFTLAQAAQRQTK